MKFLRLERKIGGTVGIDPASVVAVEGTANAGESLVFCDSFADDEGNPKCYQVKGMPDDIMDSVEESRRQDSE